MQSLSTAWLSVHRAASYLGVPVVTLRRAIERHSRRSAHGGVEARFDGLEARRLGRRWRVRLGEGWAPGDGMDHPSNQREG